MFRRKSCNFLSKTSNDVLLAIMESFETKSLNFWNTFPIPDALEVLYEIISMNCMVSGNFKAEWVVLQSGSNFADISDDNELRLFYFGIDFLPEYSN